MTDTDHLQKNSWMKVFMEYNVNIESLQYTEKCFEMNLKPNNELSPQEARAQELTFTRSVNGSYYFDGSVQEFEIPTSRAVDGIPVSVYVPTSSPAVPTILVYFHGGGLLTGSRETHEVSLKRIAEQSGVIIVNVEYRLLPCHDDPYAPFNDSVDVTDWVMKNKEAVGGCSGSTVGVGGDDAGGQLACSVTDDIQGLHFQILVYPIVTDLTRHFESFETFQDIPTFNTKDLEWQLSLTNSMLLDENLSSRTNILARDNLESSPTTLVILAQLDPLRDSIALYAQKLNEAGIKVQVQQIDGVPHGFFSLPGIFKTKTAETFALVVNFLKTFKK